MDQNTFFLKILNDIAFLNPSNLRKRKNERLQTLFPVIVGPRYQKSIFKAYFEENRES